MIIIGSTTDYLKIFFLTHTFFAINVVKDSRIIPTEDCKYISYEFRLKYKHTNVYMRSNCKLTSSQQIIVNSLVTYTSIVLIIQYAVKTKILIQCQTSIQPQFYHIDSYTMHWLLWYQRNSITKTHCLNQILRKS